MRRHKKLFRNNHTTWIGSRLTKRTRSYQPSDRSLVESIRNHRLPSQLSPFRTGYTLVELLLVVVIAAIVATVAIPAMSSAPAFGLKASARVLASDLRMASELAVQYGTEYTVDLKVDTNSYELRHTGSANPPALNNPQASPGTPAGKYVVELAPFGGNGMKSEGVRLMGAELNSSGQTVTNITFGPLGGTGPSRTEDTEIWLQRGTGNRSEYLRLTVSATTGQVWLDQPRTYPSP